VSPEESSDAASRARRDAGPESLAFRRALLEAVRCFGRDTVSFQALEPGLAYWSDDEGGFVAFVDTGSAWVAAGSPLCPEDRAATVTRRFLEAARKKRRRASFCAVDASLPHLERLPLGQQPVWDPRRFPDVLAKKRSLREQLRRAKKKGVRVRSIGPGPLDPALRASMQGLVDRWLEARRAPPLGFLLTVELFDHLEERRFVLAEQDGRLVGLLGMVPVYARSGFFFEDILRAPEAPNGTVELLVEAGMRVAAEQGATRVTMGLVPLVGPLPPFMRALRKIGGFLYGFDGLRALRVRLAPDAWEPVYLAHPRSMSRVTALWDTAAAMTAGRPLHFLFRSIARRLR